MNYSKMARVSWGYVVKMLLRKKKSHPGLEMEGGQTIEVRRVAFHIE